MGLSQSTGSEETQQRSKTKVAVENIFIFDQIACDRAYTSHRLRYNPETKYRVCVRCGLTDHPERRREGAAFIAALPRPDPPPKQPKRPKGEISEDNMSKRQLIVVRDEFEGCRYCGVMLTIKKLTLEHLKSQHLGGKSHIDNLGLSCAECNNFKGAMSEGDYLAWLLRRIPPMRIPMEAIVGLHRREAKRQQAMAEFKELLVILKAKGSPLHAHLHSPEGLVDVRDNLMDSL